jgi:hypothetical protein
MRIVGLLEGAIDVVAEDRCNLHGGWYESGEPDIRAISMRTSMTSSADMPAASASATRRS